jgi:predicted acyl esterase
MALAGQDWSNGELGGYGGSYLSLTQLALASTGAPQLKAMAIGVWGARNTGTGEHWPPRSPSARPTRPSTTTPGGHRRSCCR